MGAFVSLGKTCKFLFQIGLSTLVFTAHATMAPECPASSYPLEKHQVICMPQNLYAHWQNGIPD